MGQEASKNYNFENYSKKLEIKIVIRGAKRTGKTTLSKILKNHKNQLKNSDYFDLEIIDYTASNENSAAEAIGSKNDETEKNATIINIFMFDLTNHKTFEFVKQEISSLPKDFRILLGNFRDKDSKIKVFKPEITRFIENLPQVATSPKIPKYFEFSLKNGFGLKQLFSFLNLTLFDIKIANLRQKIESLKTEEIETQLEVDMTIENGISYPDFEKLLEEKYKTRLGIDDATFEKAKQSVQNYKLIPLSAIIEENEIENLERIDTEQKTEEEFSIKSFVADICQRIAERKENQSPRMVIKRFVAEICQRIIEKDPKFIIHKFTEEICQKIAEKEIETEEKIEIVERNDNFIENLEQDLIQNFEEFSEEISEKIEENNEHESEYTNFEKPGDSFEEPTEKIGEKSDEDLKEESGDHFEENAGTKNDEILMEIPENGQFSPSAQKNSARDQIKDFVQHLFDNLRKESEKMDY